MKKRTTFLLVVLVLLAMLSINAFASYHTRTYTVNDVINTGSITYLPNYRVSIHTEYETGIFQYVQGFSNFRATPLGYNGEGIYQRVVSNYQAEVRARYVNVNGNVYYGQYRLINSDGPY